MNPIQLFAHFRRLSVCLSVCLQVIIRLCWRPRRKPGRRLIPQVDGRNCWPFAAPATTASAANYWKTSRRKRKRRPLRRRAQQKCLRKTIRVGRNARRAADANEQPQVGRNAEPTVMTETNYARCSLRAQVRSLSSPGLDKRRSAAEISRVESIRVYCLASRHSYCI